MIIKKRKYFPYLLGISTFLIAGSAAFFSVFGLSKLFAGASASVIIMASSLEFGKIIAASFLFRYWNKINKFIRTYLAIGVIVLVFITSMGIFGFLSNAYQGATTNFEKETTQLILYEDQLESAKFDKIDLISERNGQINSYPANYATKRREVRAIYGEQIQAINNRIIDLTEQVTKLKVKLVDTGVEVGPAIYIARAFDTSVDNVVKIFIFVLIFVFDPFAIALVIATNVVLLDIITNRKQDGIEEKIIVEEKEKEKSVESNWIAKRKDLFFKQSNKKETKIKKKNNLKIDTAIDKSEKPVIETIQNAKNISVGDGRNFQDK